MPSAPDFKRLLESAPNPYLILDPKFVIIAVTDSYVKATMTRREDIVGSGIFNVFPDNPEDPEAAGVAYLRASLNRVLAKRIPDSMLVQKYDIRKPPEEGGDFEVRYWKPLNLPVLDDHGEVNMIINYVEDVTETEKLRQQDLHREELLKDHAKTITQLRRANDDLRRQIKG